jgi:hypothetical protein
VRRQIADARVRQPQIDPRARRERRQPFEQLHRLEEELRRPVRPPVPQIQDHLPVRGQVQPISRNRRAQRVAG